MDKAITFIVDHTIVPVANSIPWLISHWVLFALFGALWVAFGIGIVAALLARLPFLAVIVAAAGTAAALRAAGLA